MNTPNTLTLETLMEAKRLLDSAEPAPEARINHFAVHNLREGQSLRKALPGVKDVMGAPNGYPVKTNPAVPPGECWAFNAKGEPIGILTYEAQA